MAMRDRYLTFAGTDLRTLGLIYSTFKEVLPEPKTIYASIPAGIDIDLSEATGALGWKNGTHTFTFLLFGDTQEERLERLRAIKSKIHGVRANYKLSWDSAYTYTGRAKVSVEHYTERADLVTITIDRSPWKTSGVESITLECHPRDVASLSGSKKYRNIQVILNQTASVKLGSNAAQSLNAGTHNLATEVTGDTTVTVDAGTNWLYYVTDAGNMVVNSAVTTTVSGNDIAIDSPYTISGTDMVFSAYANQTATVRFSRVDM